MMTWSQAVVLLWVQFALSALVILLAARVAMVWIKQPVDRVQLIQVATLATMVAPVAMWLTPWHIARVGILPATRGQTAAAAGKPSVFDTAPTETTRTAESTGISVTTGPVATVAPREGIASRVASAEEGTRLRGASAAPVRTDDWAWAVILLATLNGLACVYFLTEWFIGMCRLRGLIRTVADAEPELLSEWRAITNGCGERVRVLVSPTANSPLVYGWLRPVVVVPARIAAGERGILRLCLAHEWCHIRRGDLWALKMMWICQFGLWHQPLFWSLWRELRICQDMLADDQATPDCESAVTYCELLVNSARSAGGAQIASALTLFDRPGPLMRRVTMLLGRARPLRSRCSLKFSLGVAMATVLAIAVLGGVRLDASRAAEQESRAAEAIKEPKAAALKAVAAKSGPVRLAYDCIVVDQETGKGIAGATVRVHVWDFSLVVAPFQEVAGFGASNYVTDDEGKFTIEISPEANARAATSISVGVEHDDYVKNSESNSAYSLVRIREKEGLGERPFFERIALKRAAALWGRILSPEGAPLEGVRVRGFTRAKTKEYSPMIQLDTKTDAAGFFQLKLFSKGVGAVNVAVEEFAIFEKALDEAGGDLGDIRLSRGTRIRGRALTVDGKPAAGIHVSARAGDKDSLVVHHGTVSAVTRSAITDAEGRFEMSPLPAGGYRIESGEVHPQTGRLVDLSFPGVFIARNVTIEEGVELMPVELRATPHVIFRSQYLTSQGEPTEGHTVQVSGEMEGQFWTTRGGPSMPGNDGRTVLRIPRGLGNVRVHLTSSDDSAVRYRLGPGKPLENWNGTIELGTINDEFDRLEIIRYKAPIVLVRAVDEAGQPIKEFQAAVKYPWRDHLGFARRGEMPSDIQFVRQADGRLRTTSMVPGEELTFDVRAMGYQPGSAKVKLAEGETKELVVTLKKMAGDPR